MTALAGGSQVDFKWPLGKNQNLAPQASAKWYKGDKQSWITTSVSET